MRAEPGVGFSLVEVDMFSELSQEKENKKRSIFKAGACMYAHSRFRHTHVKCLSLFISLSLFFSFSYHAVYVSGFPRLRELAPAGLPQAQLHDLVGGDFCFDDFLGLLRVLDLQCFHLAKLGGNTI